MGLEVFEGPFDWVPRVPNCCFSIDLKIGTIIIAILTVILGCSSASMTYSVGYCWPFRGQSLFSVVYWMDVFCSIFYFALVICAIIMLITVLVDSMNVWVKPYIVCWVGALVCALLSLIFAIIVYVSINSSLRCYKSFFNQQDSGIFSAVINFLIYALIGIYFCMVVNSYAAGGSGGGSSRGGSRRSRKRRTPTSPEDGSVRGESTKNPEDDTKRARSTKSSEEDAKMARSAKDSEDDTKMGRSAKDSEDDTKMGRSPKDSEDDTKIGRSAKDTENDTKMARSAIEPDDDARMTRNAKNPIMNV